MTQVNGIPDDYRELKLPQPTETDVNETETSANSVFEEELPYMPVNAEKIEDGSYKLDEVVVVAKAPKKKPPFPIDVPKLDLSSIKIELPEIKHSAADLVERYGGKFQKRKVNGVKQEIVILKIGKEKLKFAVNEDGTLGEPLIAISTFGKNKYITKSEYERRMQENAAVVEPVVEEEPSEPVETDLEYHQRIFKDILAPKRLNDDSGENLITPEILALFNEGSSELSFDDLIDENGGLKSEFRLFDLNGDNKLDEKERAFFSSGGHAISNDSANLSIENFIYSIAALDSFDETDGKVNFNTGENLYKVLTASYKLLEKINYLPPEIQQKYSEALKEVNFQQFYSKDSFGKYSSDLVKVNMLKAPSVAKLESVLLHELTHHILSNDINVSDGLMQEVETFYMQYKLYCTNKENNPNDTSSETLLNNSTIVDYARYADEIKAKDPDISEKKLAIEAFLKTYFEHYNEEYGADISTRKFKRQAKKTQFMYLK